MKKILIALGYDPGAQTVAETGHQLAKAINAKTILLHVISDFTYYSSLKYSTIVGFDSPGNAVETDGGMELEKLAENYLEKFKKHLNDESVQTILRSGEFAEVILDTAKELEVDIIVMGTHHRKGLEKILAGSVTAQVLHHTLIPLFMVPAGSLEEK